MSGESNPNFLDLLHMTYVEIERGELCIVGVQTNLETYMPKPDANPHGGPEDFKNLENSNNYSFDSSEEAKPGY